MARLSDAQVRLLSRMPDDWTERPLIGDARPVPPLVRAGLVELRQIVMPPPLGWSDRAIKTVREEWRITEAGRLALKQDGRDG